MSCATTTIVFVCVYVQVKEIEEKAKINDYRKSIKRIELLFEKGKWKEVVNLAENVIEQLQNLPEQSERATEANRDICDMLEKVK